MKRLALLFPALFLLVACTYKITNYSGSKFPIEYITSLREGETTAKQVARLFGTPQKEIIGRDGGRIWIYYYGKRTDFQDTLSERQGELESYMEILSIIFNKDGTVRSYSYTFFDFPTPYVKEGSVVKIKGHRELSQ